MDHSSEWDAVFQYDDDPSQIPTPPLSHDGSPAIDDPADVVSVSTTFYPGALSHSLPPDLVLLSSDHVFFYVHSHLLLGASTNGFRAMIPPTPSKIRDHIGPVLNVPESSALLNIILHVIYDMSVAHYSPSFDTLVAAVDAMPLYGLSPKLHITPATPLFNLLLSHAPLHPLDLYALASRFDMYDLAVPTSPHLLSFALPTLTDAMAERIGAVYLKRLFFLHFGRADALKRILLPPPHPHAPTPWCDFAEQKKLTRAWALASAYLAWDARPDMSTSAMESALSPLAEHLTCDLCKHALRERIKNLVVQWSVVKRTI